MLVKKTLRTKLGDMVEITNDVQEIVAESGVKDGICIVTVPHTTASAIITSFWDPLGHEDIQDEINKIIPSRVDFKHVETLNDASGHVKSAIVGALLSLIVEDGKVLLGSSQGIFFAEFDGPRPRQYFVKVM